MSNNVEYSVGSFDGAIVARAKVHSFNLDHVTDKDITSYYRQISSQALFDTGLLPLNGTGVLAIRSAGNHIQIAFQHAPALSYVNWGKYEGDDEAIAYTLAQPYRIWIADLIDGNLYGARMFYSPYPISSPDAQLYHVNLPNINCKGYRGNGVGWICLYHNEDWTDLSFNAKLDKLIQRCSGIEAYNDQNMSETDGPRFYRESNKPSYTWDPVDWQQKSISEGTDWTLNPDLWIPILVQDLDNQDKHYYNGQPLTFAMALIGKYNAYYNDTIHPKLINAFARPDVNIPIDQVLNIFKQAHSKSSNNPEHYDQMNSALAHREKVATTFVPKQQAFNFDDDEEDESEYFTCYSCEDKYSLDDYEPYVIDNQSYCESCFQENFTYCENTDNYLHNEDSNLLYIDHESIFIDSSQVITKTCSNCDSLHWEDASLNKPVTKVYDFEWSNGSAGQCCSVCLSTDLLKRLAVDANVDDYQFGKCMKCHIFCVTGLPQLPFFFKTKIVDISQSIASLDELKYESIPSIEVLDKFIIKEDVFLCKEDAVAVHYCPSGFWTASTMIEIEPWITPPVPLKSDPSKKVIAKITALSSISYDKSSGLPHPFVGDAVYYRCLASIYNGLTYPSPYITLFNEDGTEYSPFEI